MSQTVEKLSADNFIEGYLNWLRQSMSARVLPGTDYIEITTPFMDRHNDYTEIFIKPVDGNRYLATDGGAVLNDLELSGVNINTTKRKELFQQILNGFGVKENNGELTVTFTKEEAPRAKNNLLQAMLAVDDMFFLSDASVKGLFLEDVRKFIEKENIISIEDIQITGKSGLNQRFDFALPKVNSNPERYVKLINKLESRSVPNIIFSWTDIANTRREKPELIAFINDRNGMPLKLVNALQSYGVHVVGWEDREANLSLFKSA